ncbi:MAG: DUF1622 domain-containing protein [Aquimonas sp.]|nr:DUF1622 domain-containing protein [Aquimonas sp.]
METLLLDAIRSLILIIEGIGVLVILGGFIYSTGVWLRGLRTVESHLAYLTFRRRSVRGLILGLEFLVAADIIRTVIIDYTLDSLLMLGLIVLIRSFLVFALHLEIEGRLPWHPAAPE